MPSPSMSFMKAGSIRSFRFLFCSTKPYANTTPFRKQDPQKTPAFLSSFRKDIFRSSRLALPLKRSAGKPFSLSDRREGSYMKRLAFYMFSSNEVYYMDFLILLVKNVLCSKLRCQKTFKLKMFSYNISRFQPSSADGSRSFRF